MVNPVTVYVPLLPYTQRSRGGKMTMSEDTITGISKQKGEKFHSARVPQATEGPRVAVG